MPRHNYVLDCQSKPQIYSQQGSALQNNEITLKSLYLNKVLLCISIENQTGHESQKIFLLVKENVIRCDLDERNNSVLLFIKISSRFFSNLKIFRGLPGRWNLQGKKICFQAIYLTFEYIFTYWLNKMEYLMSCQV